MDAFVSSLDVDNNVQCFIQSQRKTTEEEERKKERENILFIHVNFLRLHILSRAHSDQCDRTRYRVIVVVRRCLFFLFLLFLLQMSENDFRREMDREMEEKHRS